VSLRKAAALLAATGLLVALFQAGVGANFTDQVTAIQNITVGTFGCAVDASGTGVSLGDYQNGHPHSVTYTVPTTINSSAPSSAPFSFSVQNYGSIDATLTIAASGTSAPFSIMNAPFSSVPLPASGSASISTGIQWTALNNSNLGQTVTATWTVECADAGTGAVIFDNTPGPLVTTQNLPSVGAEAYSFNEFGAGVTFAGTQRNLQTVTVTMSSWACQSGSWTDGSCASAPGSTFSAPITFNIYAVGSNNTVGTLLFSKTQTFNIPYRPAWDATNCPANGNYHPWYDGTACFNGKAWDITFDMTGANLAGRDSVIFGIAYNTDNHGYSPLLGSNSPMDSLNIAMNPGTGNGTVAVAPAVGSWLPDGLSAYLNATAGGEYLDGGAGGTGTFRLDAPPVSNSGAIGPYGGYEPAVQFTAN
jgi:hypothetical protein